MIILSPLFLLALNIMTVGNFPDDIKLGIVNNEISDTICTNIEIHSSMSSRKDCSQQKFSCTFLSYIDGAEKIFYNSFSDAHKDFKKGTLFGVVMIRSNFTKSLIENDGNLQDFDKNFEQVTDVYLDSSNFPFAMFIKLKIFLGFQEFIENLSRRCTVNAFLSLKPLRFEEMRMRAANFGFGVFQSMPFIVL
jgi:hypothetical protein